MRVIYIFLLALSIRATVAQAQSNASPRLIVVISVDQFSADLFAEYRGQFSLGLRQLQKGAVFPSGYQSHAATETCPGHATLLTGSYPARTGIIANEWYDQTLSRPDKRVYCAEDPSAPGSSSGNYVASAKNLKVPTLGDRMKAANPRSRVVSVAGKDRAALMLGGHAVDQLWYWGGNGFSTLAGESTPPPVIVKSVNAQALESIAQPAEAPLPEACRARAVPVVLPGKEVGIPRAPRPKDPLGFRTSLSFDRAVTDLALGLLRDLRLGQGSAPDLLTVGLSGTDYVGHAFGTQGAEMCAQLLGVDANVGRIVEALQSLHLPYVLVLTADHGAEDLPERSKVAGIQDAARVDSALFPQLMNKALEAQFSASHPLLDGAPFGDIYLSKELAAASRPQILQAVRARFAAHPQVAAVFSAAELAKLPLPSGPPDEWSLAERFRVGFYPSRSGDLLVALKPHITPLPGAADAVETHGSPWNYDRRVPILLFRPGMQPFEQPLPIQTVDILPTLAAILGLPIPAGEIDGRCLPLAELGARCPP